MPDTYYFERGDTRQSILSRMAKTQAKTVEEIWKTRSPDLPIKSPWEMVTLASIVEKETGKPEERPRVAGVFINRLEKHMRLGSDPTIVYGLVFGKGTLGRSITKAELNQSTPYNTYLIDGLPPGPISNPWQGGARSRRQTRAQQGPLFRRRRNRRPCVRRNVGSASEKRRALAADRKGRQRQARAGRDPGRRFAVRSTRSIRRSLAPLSRQGRDRLPPRISPGSARSARTGTRRSGVRLVAPGIKSIRG